MSFAAYADYWRFSGTVEDAVYKVGADAEFHAKSQLDFLKSVGMNKSSKVLDIGCGCLRGASKIIKYLDKGGYTGVDVSEGLLLAGAKRLGDAIKDKRAQLVLVDSFNYGKHLKEKFDFILANSVATHLNPQDMELFFEGAAKLLKPDGEFYFTMYPLPEIASVNSEGSIMYIRFKKSFLIGEAAKVELDVVDIEGDFVNPKPNNKLIDRVNTPYLGQWVMKGTLCKKQ